MSDYDLKLQILALNAFANPNIWLSWFFTMHVCWIAQNIILGMHALRRELHFQQQIQPTKHQTMNQIWIHPKFPPIFEGSHPKLRSTQHIIASYEHNGAFKHEKTYNQLTH